MTETTVARTTTPDLPGTDEAGTTGEWRLPVSDGADLLVVTGKFLGVGSSWRRDHSDHAGEYAVPRERCRACRWFEARIFRWGDDADGDYLVYNVGQSAVPGETPRYTVRRVATADEVIDQLTTTRGDGEPMVSLPAEIVLSQAGRFDHDIYEAYVNGPLA